MSDIFIVTLLMAPAVVSFGYFIKKYLDREENHSQSSNLGQ